MNFKTIRNLAVVGVGMFLSACAGTVGGPGAGTHRDNVADAGKGLDKTLLAKTPSVEERASFTTDTNSVAFRVQSAYSRNVTCFAKLKDDIEPIVIGVGRIANEINYHGYDANSQVGGRGGALQQLVIGAFGKTGIIDAGDLGNDNPWASNMAVSSLVPVMDNAGNYVVNSAGQKIHNPRVGPTYTTDAAYQYAVKGALRSADPSGSDSGMIKVFGIGPSWSTRNIEVRALLTMLNPMNRHEHQSYFGRRTQVWEFSLGGASYDVLKDNNYLGAQYAARNNDNISSAVDGLFDQDVADTTYHILLDRINSKLITDKKVIQKIHSCNPSQA